MDEKISPVANVSTIQEKDPVDAQNASMIKIVNKDPNMFSQVDIVHGKPFLSSSSQETSQAQTKRNENQPKTTRTCFFIPEAVNQVTCLALDYTEVMLVIRETLTNNLITAIFIIAAIPSRFLAIINFHKPSDYLTFVSLHNYLKPFRITFPMAHTVLTFRKLTITT